MCMCMYMHDIVLSRSHVCVTASFSSLPEIHSLLSPALHHYDTLHPHHITHTLHGDHSHPSHARVVQFSALGRYASIAGCCVRVCMTLPLSLCYLSALPVSVLLSPSLPPSLSLLPPPPHTESSSSTSNLTPVSSHQGSEFSQETEMAVNSSMR